MKRAAAVRRLEASARSALPSTYVGVNNPLEALSELAGEILATKNIIRGHVQDLEARTDRIGREDVGAILAAYERALDRSERVLVSMARLDIDSRLAHITEEQARQIVDGLRWVVGEARTRLDLTEAATAALSDLVGEMLGRLRDAV